MRMIPRAPGANSPSGSPSSKRSAWTALIVGFALIALGAAVAWADDTVFPDGDTGVADPNIAYGSGANAHACADRGTPVSGEVTVNYNGNGTDAAHHFTPGEALDVSFAPAAASGITVDPGTIPNVPATWGTSASDSFTIPFTTTVAPTLASTSYVEVTVTGHTSDYSAGDGSGSGRPRFNVNIDCSPSTVTNVTPSVAFTSPPNSATEGDTKTFSFSITDSDADTWSYAGGYPNCGDYGSVSGTPTIVGKTGSFSCVFPDGLVPATDSTSTVSVQVSDGHALSNAATTDVTVNNADPVVGALTLGGNTGSACLAGKSVTLDFGFTDPGVNDADWGVDIDWGDGSTDTTYSAGLQGTQSQQSHLYYGAGSWTVGADVTDKDLGSGSASSAADAVSLLYSTGQGILQPINYTGSRSAFKSGSTIPVKIKITDCAGTPVSGLHPQVSIKYLDGSPDGISIEDFYSTVPDQGTTMRYTGTPDYQYIYNLGTKGRASGDYTVTVSDAAIAPVTATFSIKK
jgi:hypothetical protein